MKDTDTAAETETRQREVIDKTETKQRQNRDKSETERQRIGMTEQPDDRDRKRHTKTEMSETNRQSD